MDRFAKHNGDTAQTILWAMGPVQDDQRATAFLRDQGWNIRRAYRGRDVTAALNDSQVDLVLLDIDIPDGDGLWALDHLNLAGFTGPVIAFDRARTPQQPIRAAEIRKRAFLIHAPITTRRLHQICTAILNDLPDAVSSLRQTPQDTAAPGRAAAQTLSHLKPEFQEAPMNNSNTITGNTLPEGIAGESRSEPRNASESYGGFIGTSPVMLNLYEQIQNAARSHAPVFITGESGTGKDVCAQAIHTHSPRKDKTYIPINCAAIPRDLLESEIFGHVRGAFTGAVSDRAGAAKLADGGTLFLDEIGEMDPQMQTKLLRFLQDGTFLPVGGSKFEKVDVRILCATNRDPFADIQSGRLREDLFYRLHVLPLPMPPLRARGDDIIDIAQTLLLRYAHEERKRFQNFSAAAEAILRRYNWPGNIRQLQNAVRQIVVMHDGLSVTPDMIPRDITHIQEGIHANDALGLQRLSGTGDDDYVLPSTPSNDGPSSGLQHPRPRLGHLDGSLNSTPAGGRGGRIIPPLHVTERQAIEQAIALCAGNIPRAAALLEISPSTIYRKKAQWEQPERL